jgi:hypothetical protein
MSHVSISDGRSRLGAEPGDTPDLHVSGGSLLPQAASVRMRDRANPALRCVTSGVVVLLRREQPMAAVTERPADRQVLYAACRYVRGEVLLRIRLPEFRIGSTGVYVLCQRALAAVPAGSAGGMLLCLAACSIRRDPMHRPTRGTVRDRPCEVGKCDCRESDNRGMSATAGRTGPLSDPVLGMVAEFASYSPGCA